MNEILQYLKENQGRPVFVNDIYQALPGFSEEILNGELQKLISQGMVYPYNNAFYLTQRGNRLLEKFEVPKDDPYEKAHRPPKGITYETREKYVDKWLNHFLVTLEYFKKNHPELEDLFNALGIRADQDIGGFHDAREFAKDVQAIFNRFNFKVPELKYPGEKLYSIPKNLASIEHAIAESLIRLKKYSPRHLSYVPSTTAYRKVYDEVDNFLNDSNISSYLIQNLQLKPGMFIKKSEIIPKLMHIFLKENSHLSKSLVNTVFNFLRNKIETLVQQISPDVFFEGSVKEDSASKLYYLIQKEGKEVYNNFADSAPSPEREQILNILFNNNIFNGIDFSGCKLRNINILSCNFAEVNFNAALFDKSTIINNNFTLATFKGTSFKGVNVFKDNNIEGADFEAASLSPVIDTNMNIGEPINLVSLVVTKEEMKEKGFRGKESFNHVGISYDNKVPGYTLDAKGEDWVRYIYATQDTPFPVELFNTFKLHGSVPGDYSLGWIGGKWNSKVKILYVTEMQSDLMQRTYELSPKWLENEGYGRNHKFIKNGWDKLKSKLENYYDGWQYVFFNQAVREAKERGAKYIATPTSEYYKKKYLGSPYQYYDKIVHQKVTDPATGESKIEPRFPYKVEGHWRMIPVNTIEKWASKKLNWRDFDSLGEKLNYRNVSNFEHYDINPLTEINLYPTKDKEDQDYVKYKLDPTDPEMLFEKGLHETTNRPETGRNLTPYGNKKLSWNLDESIYAFEDQLRNQNISFYRKGDTYIINDRGDVFLDSLTFLPNNIEFNNRGGVNLSSLTSLPNNIEFNNEGYVNLNSLTSLPNNIEFNNRGYVNLFSLTSLPENKYEIFKNGGNVYYNNLNSIFNTYQKESKLSWNLDKPTQMLKFLRAYDGKDKGYFFFTKQKELVLPEVLTNNLGFHGIESRYGTELAYVVEENLSIENLARMEVEKFFGDSIVRDANYIDLVVEKMKYIKIIVEDIQPLSINTIIKQVRNPENGSDWFEIVEISESKLSSLKFSKEEPSDAQIEAGNYKKKHVKKDGLDISIENEKGSSRSGEAKDGKKWSIKMKNDYGYIKGTVGKDKDHLDCFLSNNYKQEMPVFIINQLNNKGYFDEHKIMLGFENKKDAEKAYLDNYEEGWENYDKDLIKMNMEDFKKWMKEKDKTKKKAVEGSAKLTWERYSLSKGDRCIKYIDKESLLQKISLDKVYWKTYMEKYIDVFIRTQERIEPGLGTKKELAKDAFNFMMDEIPEEVKRDVQFPEIITSLREDLIEKGIGDIFDNTPSYLDRTHQENDGSEFVDPTGKPIEEISIPEKVDYEEKEDVNSLLDQLSKAQGEGNQEKIEEIKKRLDRIIGLSSLIFKR